MGQNSTYVTVTQLGPGTADVTCLGTLSWDFELWQNLEKPRLHKLPCVRINNQNHRAVDDKRQLQQDRNSFGEL